MSTRLNVTPITTVSSLKDHIYGTLKNAITQMDIYAEDADLRLDERKLASQLATSRTPLREALVRLEHEGLVEILPRRGVMIARKSIGEILEMIVAWAALESMAARLATQHASDAELAALHEFLLNEGDRPGHIDEYSEANIRFHQRILELSRCRLLSEMAEGLFIHMRAIRTRTMHEDDRVRLSLVDHREIVRALEARDGDRAARLVREHSMNLHDHVRSTWSDPRMLTEGERLRA